MTIYLSGITEAVTGKELLYFEIPIRDPPGQQQLHTTGGATADVFLNASVHWSAIKT